MLNFICWMMLDEQWPSGNYCSPFAPVAPNAQSQQKPESTQGLGWELKIQTSFPSRDPCGSVLSFARAVPMSQELGLELKRSLGIRGPSLGM